MPPREALGVEHGVNPQPVALADAPAQERRLFGYTAPRQTGGV